MLRQLELGGLIQDSIQALKVINIEFFRIIMVAALPVAFLAVVLLPNEYLAAGIDGVADCDGPLGVMMFAVPSYIMYGIGVVRLGVQAVLQRNLCSAMTALLCIVVLVLISPNAGKAYREHSSLLHQQSCRKGW